MWGCFGLCVVACLSCCTPVVPPCLTLMFVPSLVLPDNLVFRRWSLPALKAVSSKSPPLYKRWCRIIFWKGDSWKVTLWNRRTVSKWIWWKLIEEMWTGLEWLGCRPYSLVGFSISGVGLNSLWRNVMYLTGSGYCQMAVSYIIVFNLFVLLPVNVWTVQMYTVFN